MGEPVRAGHADEHADQHTDRHQYADDYADDLADPDQSVRSAKPDRHEEHRRDANSNSDQYADQNADQHSDTHTRLHRYRHAPNGNADAAKHANPEVPARTPAYIDEGQHAHFHEHSRQHGDEDRNTDKDGLTDTDADTDFGGDAITDADKGVRRDADRDLEPDQDQDPDTVTDSAAPGLESTPGVLKRLSEESWNEVVALRDDVLREVAGLEEKASSLRKVLGFLEAVLQKRNASEGEQRSAAEGLFAAMREAGAPNGSFSMDQIRSRLLLGLVKVGREQ